MTLYCPDGTTIDPVMVHRMIAGLPVTASARRAAQVRELLAIGVRLRALAVELAGADGNSGRLGAGMAFLDAQEPDVDPAREAIWMDWHTTYTTACDLLEEIGVVIVGGAPA